MITKKAIKKLGLTALLYCSLASAQAADQPNFVWIISEDNSKHFLKHFDTTGISTPHIEALAEDGVTFEAVCSNAPVCSVARTTLLTGCHLPRIGAQYHRTQKLVPMPEGLMPFPFYLKKAGYFTANKGKTDYNVAINFKASWSSRKDWTQRKKGQPFFYQLSSLSQSHESSGHFKKGMMEKNPMKHLTEGIFIPPHHPNTPTMRYSYAYYHSRMKIIDEKVGNLVKKLKTDGVYENTIIFYFGDHGGILPRSKGYAYETGLNPPLVIRFPDKWKHLIPFQKNSRTEVNLNFYDFGPSLLNAAGIEIPKQCDGKPFLGPDITKKSLTSRSAFGYADRFDEKYDLVRTIRSGSIKYIRNYQPYNSDSLHSFYRYRSLAYLEIRNLFRSGKLNATQNQFFKKRAPEALYDLKTDPYELNNLAGDSNHSDILKMMREQLKANVKKTNDLSFYPESHLLKNALKNPSSFGEQHSKHIHNLIDIADLQLNDYATAKADINTALKSEDPWERYWGCITASTFAQKDQLKTIQNIAATDKNLMVKTRAGEYLALIGETIAGIKTISDAAKASNDAVELNLILNSAAMVFEIDPINNTFNLSADKLQTTSPLVKERINYLATGK